MWYDTSSWVQMEPVEILCIFIEHYPHVLRHLLHYGQNQNYRWQNCIAYLHDYNNGSGDKIELWYFQVTFRQRIRNRVWIWRHLKYHWALWLHMLSHFLLDEAQRKWQDWWQSWLQNWLIEIHALNEPFQFVLNILPCILHSESNCST